MDIKRIAPWNWLKKKEAYEFSFEIPGMDKKDVRIELMNGSLTISGEKRNEKEEKGRGRYTLCRTYGSFQKVLPLPGDAKEKGIKATFNQGVLNIMIPREAGLKSGAKQIEVKDAA